MEYIKSFLRKIDIFGFTYSFKYNSEEKYTTAIGGLIVILFIPAAIYMGIYYFIPFYHQKNFTTVYYTLTMANADRISFSESKTSFALGLNCWTGNDGTTADQLFKIDYKYIHWQLDENNTYVRTISTLGFHQCNKKDFYNNFNETFDASQIYKYQCFDDPSITIEGIWTSEIFSYFQFEVNAKNNSRELLDKIDDYLHGNDCKFQIYYVDNTIDIDDYRNPIKSYVEAIFIQINPTLSIRRNLYFMNQYLFDDDNLFWVFSEDDDEASLSKTLFSRFEEYSLFQGLTRQKNATDYLNFVKLYIRADTKKTDVKRRYQKINEFFADASALLVTIYEVLNIIFEFLNTFWAEQTLSKNIFFFQDFDHKLNIVNKQSKIKELLNITGSVTNNFKLKTIDTIDDIPEKPLDTIQNFKKEKILYKEKKTTSKNIQNLHDILTKNEDIPEGIDYNYEKISNSYGGKEYNLDSKNNINSNKRSKNNEICETNFSSENNIYNVVTTCKDNETSYGDNEIEKVEYEYNLLNKIVGLACKCCLSRKLKIKDDLYEKAISFLDNKLDIVLYIRNMILIDIINKTILDNDTKDILNFLTRPIISLKDSEEDDMSLFYEKYKNTDFDKFYNELIQISNKKDKRNEEKKLISVCNKQLKKINI